MVVLIIIGIAVSAAMPSMRASIANSQADRLKSELQLDLGFARSQSITLSDSISVQPISGSWDTGWRILRGTTELRNRGGTDNPIAESGTITSADFSTATPVTFDRQGRATTTGSIRILVSDCTGSRDYSLSINQIGQIVIAEVKCP